MSRKITFLLLHLNYGGLEKQTVTLINELAKDDEYDIELIVVYNILGNSFYNINDKVKIKYLIPYGPNKKEVIDSFKHFKIFKFFKELFKGVKILYLKYKLMKKEIINLNTDVIISSRIEFSKLIRRKDTINISQEHSFFNTLNYKFKVKRSFDYIDYVVVMTKKAEEIYNKWIKNSNINVVCIPNMVSSDNDDLNVDKGNQILAVGRLEDIKRFDLLINMFSEFVKVKDNFVLKIIGSGSKEKYLKNLVKSLNINDKVIFTGKLEDFEVYNEMKRSKMLCVTSLSESFSLVIVEAMKYYLPCVAFDVDVGPREIIENGKNGFLCRNNDFNLYINLMVKLIEDDELYNKMSVNAHKTAEIYYSNNVVKLWKKIID